MLRKIQSNLQLWQAAVEVHDTEAKRLQKACKDKTSNSFCLKDGDEFP